MPHVDRALLIHAHPGHELRLFHWMERVKPIVFLLTDGSAREAPSRTGYSARCVESANSKCGAVFAAAPDRAWYEAILRRDVAPFIACAEAAVATAVKNRCTLIVTDAVDGYNPMHDLCEALGAAVIAMLRREGRQARHLVSRAVSGSDGEVVVELQLDGQAKRRKQAAVEAYTPLAEEARCLLESDTSALAVERLRRAEFSWPGHWSPAWEEIGRARVVSRCYAEPIGYTSHVRPIALALLGAVSA